LALYPIIPCSIIYNNTYLRKVPRVKGGIL
jgi:hypothetical protein